MKHQPFLKSLARGSAWGLNEFGTVLDPGTQPCYAAAMPDTDSRPLVALLNDLSIMSRLRLLPIFEAAAVHRIAGRCNLFGLTIGFHGTFDGTALLSMFVVDRGLLDDSAINPPGAELAADSRLIEMHGSPASTIAAGPVTRPMRWIP